MKNIQDIDEIKFHAGSKEELLPNFTTDFPYIATRTELDKYRRSFVPWHWHRTVEIFYMKKGAIEYCTPNGKIIFPEGSGGMINSGVLHMTKTVTQLEKNVQLLHIFDVSLIGEMGSRIEQKYITPITAAPQIEMIALFPEVPEQKKILELILSGFYLSNNELGYEIKLREILSEIWLALFAQSQPLLEKAREGSKGNDKIKLMMIYIHEHYSERISIRELATSAFLSERECFRVFHEYLHMTPVEYIRSYRLQKACQMLEKGQVPITDISHACGLGSSSYFGKVFREYIHCTPSEYRRIWQDSDNKRQK